MAVSDVPNSMKVGSVPVAIPVRRWVVVVGGSARKMNVEAVPGVRAVMAVRNRCSAPRWAVAVEEEEEEEEDGEEEGVGAAPVERGKRGERGNGGGADAEWRFGTKVDVF